MIKALWRMAGKARSPKSLYFLSFALVILVSATTLGTLFYTTSAKMMVETFTENNLIGLNHLLNTLDLLLEDADRILLSIGLNSSLEEYERFRTTDVVAARRIQELLDSHASLDANISSISVVFTKSRKVVSSTIGYQDVATHLDHEYLTGLLESRTRPRLWYFRQGPQSPLEPPKPQITIVRPLPIGRHTDPSAYIVLNINSSILDKAFRTVTIHERSVLQIFDREKHLIFESRGQGYLSQFPPQDYGFLDEVLKTKASLTHGHLNNEESLITYAESERHPILMVYGIPLRTVTKTADELGFYILLFCVGIVILALVMSSALAEALLYPLRRLQRILSSRPSRYPLSFSELETGANHLVEENGNLRDSIKSFLDQRVSRIILELMEGRRMLESSSRSELRELGLVDLELRPFLIVAIRVDLSSLTVEKEIFLIIQQKLEEEKAHLWGVLIRKSAHQWLGFLASKDQGPGEETLSTGKNSLLSELKTRVSVDVDMGVSTIHRGLSQANMAYRQAMVAQEKARHYGNVNGYQFAVDQDAVPAVWSYPYQVEERFLIALFDHQDEGEAKAIFDEFTSSIRTEDSIGSLSEYYCHNQLMHAMMGALFSRDPTLFSIVDQDNQFQSFFSALDGNSQGEIFQQILSKIIALQKSRRRLQNSLLVDDIKRHIETHLDQDNTFETLAEHFRISPSYLRKIFKANVGKTLKEFSLERKMDRAKHDLKEGNLTIQEIAQSLGFQTTQSFIRCFKQKEGITPGQHRTYR